MSRDPVANVLAVKLWRERNLDRWRESTKRYRERHPEKMKAYREVNAERLRAHAKSKYEAAKAAGLCVRCSSLSDRIGKTLCSGCHQGQLEAKRKQKYGVAAAEVAGLLEAQDFRCAICLASIKTDAHVDHDHQSGKVRGLLCGSCNRGLGMFRDSPETLERATAYLQRVER